MIKRRGQIFSGIKKTESGREIFFVCALCSALYVLFFTACAITPDIEDVKQSEAHNKLGYSYLNNEQLSEAFIEFQKAIKLNPENKDALNYLGYISARFRRYDEAVSYYKRAISADPDYSDAMNNLGVTFLDMGNWDEAITYFKAALSNPIYATPEKAFSNMGYAYYKKSDYQKAEETLKEALLRNPVFPVANYYLGLVYVKLGDDKAAVEEFKKTLGIMPEYMDAHWELAQAYLRSGGRDDALEHFRIIADKDTDTKRSREALQYIEMLK